MSQEVQLQESLKARVPYGMNEDIKRVILDNPLTYYNFSHFVRCALMRELRRVQSKDTVMYDKEVKTK